MAVLTGIAIAASTCEAAFAVLVAATDRVRRDATILWLTLITAFTSAFYYPLEAWLGWRHTLLVLAGMMAFAVQAAGASILWFFAGSLVWAAVGIACFGFGVGVATIARPAIVADRYGAARYAGIMAALMVPVALARAGAPLIATALPGFLGVATVISVIAALILVAVRAK